jgi:hypothetical protein
MAFEKISDTSPTYTLLNNSPDGYAMVLIKVHSIVSWFQYWG